MKNLLPFTLMLLLFTNMQCNKSTTPPEPPTTQPNGLPLATQEGKNTFGCFWNDTLWLPVFQPLAGPELDAVYYKDFGYSFISASNKINLESFSIITFNEKIGTYEIDSTCEVQVNFNKRYRGFDKSFKLQLTKFVKPEQSKYGIISGNFSATMYRIYSFGTGVKDSFDFKDSIIITKGVFDVKLR